jgi:polysaccharide pyruvyl transferase WcaK-like protein
MNVLVVGEYFSTNLGDGVICETVQKLIEKYFKKEFSINQIDILDISGEKEFSFVNTIELGKTSFKSKLLKILPSETQKKIILNHRDANICYTITFDEYDLVIFAGGQLLMEHFTLQINRILEICKDKEIPVIYNSLGFREPNSAFIEKQIVKNLTHESVKRITVRDHEHAVKTRTNKEVSYVPDNALLSGKVFDIVSSDSECIGLGIMYFKEKEALLDEFWKNIIEILEQKRIKWKFFVNGSNYDYQYAKKLAAKFGFLPSQSIERPESPKELISVIAQFGKIISFRLHSHIIAYSLQIPSIALTWDKKLEYFFDSIDHSEALFDFENTPVETILEALDNAVYGASDLEKLEEAQEKILCNMKENLLICKVGDNN